MPNYRRARVGGGTYFFIVVTHDRRAILGTTRALELLRQAIEVRGRHPFVIEAMVVLLYHLHAIWTLLAEDADYSMCWRLIKARFTSLYLRDEEDSGGISTPPSVSDRSVKPSGHE